MILDELKTENRLTEKEHIALKYLKSRVKKYLSELEKRNPAYLADLHDRYEADLTDQRKMNWLLFEIQELAEDLTGAIFDEEQELKRYHRELKKRDESESLAMSFALQRLVQGEIEHQLVNIEEILFDCIPRSEEHIHSITSILVKLGRK
jgi:hypothetical protein